MDTPARRHLYVVNWSDARPPVTTASAARGADSSRSLPLSVDAQPQGDGKATSTPDESARAPRKFADCVESGLGDWVPCPYVACEHHLAIEVRSGSLDGSGGIYVHAPATIDPVDGLPDLDLDAMPETCTVQAIANRGDLTLEEVGELLGVTRERVRQIEAKAIKKLRGAGRARFVDEIAGAGAPAKPSRGRLV